MTKIRECKDPFNVVPSFLLEDEQKIIMGQSSSEQKSLRWEGQEVRNIFWNKYLLEMCHTPGYADGPEMAKTQNHGKN